MAAKSSSLETKNCARSGAALAGSAGGGEEGVRGARDELGEEQDAARADRVVGRDQARLHPAQEGEEGQTARSEERREARPRLDARGVGDVPIGRHERRHVGRPGRVRVHRDRAAGG